MTPTADPVLAPADALAAALRAARRGDPASYAAVVRAIERPLRRYLIARAPGAADVDELAQQTLIQAFDALPGWREDGDPTFWLLGVARNVVRRAWRTHVRELERRDAAEAELGRRLAQRAEREPDEDVRLAALAECESELSERWRAIVGWHYREGWTLERIATELGNAKGTVGATLFRIRAQLRECVQEKLR